MGHNFEPNAWIANSTLATVIAKFKSSADSQPLRMPDAVAAVPTFRSNQVPMDGVSPNTCSLFVGDFRELMIGLRTSFRLEVTRTGGDAFTNLQVWVRCYLRADVQLSHPEAFNVLTSVGTGAYVDFRAPAYPAARGLATGVRPATTGDSDAPMFSLLRVSCNPKLYRVITRYKLTK